jgi:hypothetical protein
MFHTLSNDEVRDWINLDESVHVIRRCRILGSANDKLEGFERREKPTTTTLQFFGAGERIASTDGEESGWLNSRETGRSHEPRELVRNVKHLDPSPKVKDRLRVSGCGQCGREVQRHPFAPHVSSPLRDKVRRQTLNVDLES